MYFKHMLTRVQARELDRLAVERFGIKSLILMENAGRACAGEAALMLGGAAGKKVSIFCGKGNNGGDGFVTARHLSNMCADVRVFLTGTVEGVLRDGGDAASNLNIILKMRLPMTEIADQEAIGGAVKDCREADLIVDALLGTGVTGEVRGLQRPLIDALNSLKKPLLAVDLPSGLDCDTGEVLGSALICRRTVSFAGAKRGFENPDALLHTGEVKIADISIPRRLIEEKMEEWRRG